MTLSSYDRVVEQVAREFHDKYIANPNRSTDETFSIAKEYTNFILDRFDELIKISDEFLNRDN